MKSVFNTQQIKIVNEAVAVAEELVSNFYKISTSQWLKNRYDFVTMSGLTLSEIIDGPHAQVIRYVGYNKSDTLGSSAFDYYKICIQDYKIISTVKKTEGLNLFPFVLYISVHELIHVVRFSRFVHNYNISSESDVVREEEIAVHAMTREILETAAFEGMDNVFSYYKKWYHA
jgi:hypothetical protein